MNVNVQKGQIANIILSCLLDKDKYGKELLNAIQEKTFNQLSVKQATLYSNLNKLEKQEFISSYWRDGETGGKRHYYSITDLGKKYLLNSETVIYTNKVNENLQQKTEKNTPQKYDEIGDFQNQDEQIVEQNAKENNNISSVYEKEYISSPCTIEQELKLLNTTKNSFSQNQKNQTIVSVQQYNQNNNINITNQNDLKNQTDEILIKSDESNSNIVVQDSQNIHEDQGVFINDYIDNENIPKVKKLQEVNMTISDNSAVLEKISPNNEKGFNEKLKDLYSKSKNNKIHSGESNYISHYPSLTNLHNRYDEMNIKFYSTAKPEPYQETYSSTKIVKGNVLFIKYSIIWAFIAAITGVSYLIFSLLNLPLHYTSIFIVIPTIFTFFPIFYLILKNKRFNVSPEKSYWLSALIIFVGVVLLYSLNMLLGMHYNNILDFADTFIYPSALLLVVVVSILLDNKIYKKYFNI